MNVVTPELLSAIIHISELAADEILKFYNVDYNIDMKDDLTPVTSADFAAHSVILNALTELTPNIPVLSEEAANIPFHERKTWDTYWLVDPLDGTREFIKRNGEFSVNIALISGNESVLGVIYIPVTQTCYYATKGNGAYKKENGEIAKPISAKKTCQESIIIAGSRSYRDTSLDNFLKNIELHSGQYEIICMGSSIKSCLVAEGKVDIYPRLGPTSEWDTAAAQCIVEESGGLITDTSLQPLKYNTKDTLLNPHFLAFADKSVNWPNFL